MEASHDWVSFSFAEKVARENDVYSVNDTGILGKKSDCSYQESNLRPSDYSFGFSTTELQETRAS